MCNKQQAFIREGSPIQTGKRKGGVLIIRQEKNGKWGTVKSLFRNRPLILLHLLEGDDFIHYILSSVCPVMDAFVFRPSF